MSTKHVSPSKNGLRPGRAIAMMVGLMLAGSVLTGAGLTAQGQVFAKPWEVDFAKIKTAMEGRNYSIHQVRRVWEEVGVPNDQSEMVARRSLVGTVERLELKGDRNARAGAVPTFALDLIGMQAKKLGSEELAAKRKEFSGSSRTMFLYHGFRVQDPVLADKNYVLYYVGTATRIQRATYRFVVLPKTWDRSAWLLDLDQETGYPLYQGEYDLAAQLQSEVVVEKLKVDPIFAVGKAWSQPSPTTKHYASADGALKAAMPKHKQHLSLTKDLPSGYALTESRVSFARNSTEKTAVLVYGDGLEQIFCLQRGVPQTQLSNSGHRLFTYNNLGVTICQFSHGGVEFRLIGGSEMGMLVGTSKALFARSVATIQ